MDASSIYSCDDHLDLNAVPRELWQSRLPKGVAERAPRVVDRDGEPTWIANERVLGRSGRPPGASPLKALSAIGRAGIEDDGFRASTPKLRLEDMDRDGIWASVIYGPVPLTLSIPEPDLQSACYAAWNDWAIEEFNAAAPDRLCVLPFLPSHSPDAAVAELERCAAIGHRGALIDVFDFDAGDPAWNRLWAAAEDTGLPLSFHIKGGASPRLSYQVGTWQSAAFATLLPLQLDEAVAIMVFSGALERHPGLKLVLAESGIGWLPYYLTRMDLEWRNLRDKVNYAPSIPPSELFHRQVIATFEEEELAAQFIPYLGADACMWASDYPHTDSTFPESQRAIDEALGTLPAEDRHKITAFNCAILYGFDYVAG
jgi:predicted TIM-barrel fold metal-dependent hydrolase